MSITEKVKWLEEYCHKCGKQINSWDERCSKALGYQHSVCESCIAKEYDVEINDLRATMEDTFGMRPCMGI
jgi:predicted amidophosphoribosyltransferase